MVLLGVGTGDVVVGNALVGPAEVVVVVVVEGEAGVTGLDGPAEAPPCPPESIAPAPPDPACTGLASLSASDAHWTNGDDASRRTTNWHVDRTRSMLELGGNRREFAEC
jgi:hypothetical protein